MRKFMKAALGVVVLAVLIGSVARSALYPRGICPVCGHAMLTQWTELPEHEVPYLADLHRSPELMRCPVDGHLETF